MSDPRRLSEAALAAIGEQAEKATPGPWEMTVRTDRSEDTFYTVRTVEKHPDHPWSQRYVSWLNGTLRNRERPRYRYCETCKHGHYDHQEVGSEIRDDHSVGDDAAFIAAARTAVPALLDHAAYLAERLAEAEWVTCGSTYTDPETERITEAMRLDQGLSIDEGCKRRLKVKYAFRCVECGRWFDRDCIVKHFTEHGDDLRAQLARERADHAATVAELTERLELADSVAIKNVHYWQGLLDKERSDHGDTVAVGNAFIDEINKERAARLAAEGQVAELRMALEDVEWSGKEYNHGDIDPCCPVCLQSAGVADGPPMHRPTCPIGRALAATPSNATAAVLAAAEVIADSYEMWCTEGHYSLTWVLSPMVDAVAAWRAARGDQGGKDG